METPPNDSLDARITAAKELVFESPDALIGYLCAEDGYEAVLPADDKPKPTNFFDKEMIFAAIGAAVAAVIGQILTHSDAGRFLGVGALLLFLIFRKKDEAEPEYPRLLDPQNTRIPTAIVFQANRLLIVDAYEDSRQDSNPYGLLACTVHPHEAGHAEDIVFFEHNFGKLTRDFSVRQGGLIRHFAIATQKGEVSREFYDDMVLEEKGLRAAFG